jgi:DNA-binding NarL/FixJ family response regulator
MKKIRAIIVSLPGTWQRILRKNIEAHAFVEVIAVVGGSLTASQFVNQHHPDLVLIDSSVPFDDTVALARNLKKQNPKTKSIVITDTTQQRRKITQAGADYTLSSYNYEFQIGEILHQMNGTHPNEPEIS